MQGPALAVAEDAGEIDDSLLAGRQQLLQREFRRGVEIAGGTGAVRADEFGGKSVQVGLVPGRDLQDGGLGLDEALGGEPGMKRRRDAVAGKQQRPPVAVASTVPEGRQSGHFRQQSLAMSAYNPLAVPGKIAKVRAKLAASAAAAIIEVALKVIASQVRKGNVVEADGQLYVVLTAENFHPGKGTPTTQIDMRRISDGVKVSQRYKTTEQVERAFVEDHDYQFLFQDGDGFTFMNGENYEQVHVSKDIVGDQAPYLQENMTVRLSLYNGLPIAIELPQRVTLEVVETDPAMKGQTAASSYKPALLSNGVKTNVPPHIAVGTRIVVMTADGAYVERAKD